MFENGYIKFNCKWIKSDPVSKEMLAPIIECRDRLYDLGLIGAYKNGIGFGNVSIRSQSTNNFIITGSATGNYPKSNEQHYSDVIDYDIEKNSLTCKGPIKASSESLSHAVIYLTEPSTNCVIHVHNLDLWKSLMNRVPTTSKNVEYGTPEMAKEIIRLFNETELRNEKILVMGGHEEGVITFGKDIKEAIEILFKYFNKR